MTTHVFLAGDPYLGSDAAYAVKDALVREPVRRADGCEEITFDIKLVPLDWKEGQ
ncbi:hypothetical protein [Nonomuraea salmonea]|uniref:dioxygenase family protein n=1 Tax=Nonomuraea salmonea TaxID=46181 RepID=UPI002FEB26D3